MINDAIINEMVEDIENLKQHFLSFNDRWRTITNQLAGKVSLEQQDRIDAAFIDCIRTFDLIAGDDWESNGVK
jgi:hypothetical protein